MSHMSQTAESSRLNGRVVDPHQPRRRRRNGKQTSVLVILGLISCLMLSPLWWSALTAIKPFKSAFTTPPTWVFTPTFQSVADLWENTGFAAVALNTLVICILTVIISLAIAAPAGYALARYRGSSGAWLLVLALVFRALPRFAFVLPFYEFARRVGLYDTKTIIVIAMVAINQPFTLWLLRNFFADLPVELDEAAMIDGCSRFSAFRRVILPLAVPGLFTAGVFTTLLAYQEYLVVITLAQTNANTVSVFIASFANSEYISLFQATAASSIILTIPAFIFAMFAQKYLVAGLSSGAVKG